MENNVQELVRAALEFADRPDMGICWEDPVQNVDFKNICDRSGFDHLYASGQMVEVQMNDGLSRVCYDGCCTFIRFYPKRYETWHTGTGDCPYARIAGLTISFLC